MSYDNTNAREELERATSRAGSRILCADIRYEMSWEEKDHRQFLLKLDYDEEQDLWPFLADLEFNYDSGYGTQRLYGTVWLSDGTWLSRGEYDGSEWWEHHQCPPIPEYLKGPL